GFRSPDCLECFDEFEIVSLPERVACVFPNHRIRILQPLANQWPRLGMYAADVIERSEGGVSNHCVRIRQELLQWSNFARAADFAQPRRGLKADGSIAVR